MRLKQRVERLENWIDDLQKDICHRLKQLECEHDPVPKERYGGFWPERLVYYLECSKCGKVLRCFATETEYLKERLARMTDQCATDKAAIKARLKALKEE